MRSPGPDCFAGEFYQTFEEITTILKLFQKIEYERILSNSLYEASIILVPKLEKDLQEKKIIDEYL